MKIHQKLDKTLTYLNTNKAPFGEKSIEVYEALKITEDTTEQHLLLEKLRDDKYVYVLFDKKSGTTEIVNENDPYYRMNYHGIVFLENGGYGIEYAIRKREMFNRKLLSFLNPAWKILGFIAAIGAVVKLYLSFC